MTAALVIAVVWLALSAPGMANAFEAEEAFAKGTKIFGLQANGGVQNNIQHETETSGIDFIGFQPRFSYLPLQPFGSRWYRAAIEPGVEGGGQGARWGAGGGGGVVEAGGGGGVGRAAAVGEASGCGHPGERERATLRAARAPATKYGEAN